MAPKSTQKSMKIIPASTPNRERRIIEKDKGRRLGGLASLGPLGARLLKRNIEKDQRGALGAWLLKVTERDTTGHNEHGAESEATGTNTKEQG